MQRLMQVVNFIWVKHNWSSEFPLPVRMFYLNILYYQIHSQHIISLQNPRVNIVMVEMISDASHDFVVSTS